MQMASKAAICYDLQLLSNQLPGSDLDTLTSGAAAQGEWMPDINQSPCVGTGGEGLPLAMMSGISM